MEFNDLLKDVLSAAANKTVIGGDVKVAHLKLISLSRSEEDRHEKVRGFQRAIFRKFGVALDVVGGGYGCLKIMFVARNVEHTIELIKRLGNDAEVKAIAKASGFHLLILDGLPDEGYERHDLRTEGPEHASADFAIVTALRDPEFVELKKSLITASSSPEKLIDSNSLMYYEYNIQGAGENSYLIRATFPQQMGNSAAAAMTTRILIDWKPRYTVLVGIAGSLQKKVRLGDAVVASQVFNCDDRRKEGPSEIVLAPLGYPTDRALLQKAEHMLVDDTWLEGWRERARNGSEMSFRPEIHVGDLAVVNGVIDSVSARERLTSTNRKLLAVEMEAGGVLEATISDRNRSRVMVVRGISDLASEKEQTSPVWRQIAARSAAAFVIQYIRAFGSHMVG